MMEQKLSLYLSTTRMLMVAQHLNYAVHRHSILQVTFSLDGFPFDIWTEANGWRQAEAVVINANVKHSLKGFKGWQVTTCIIPEVKQGQLLQNKFLAGEPICYINSDTFNTIKSEFIKLKDQQINDAGQFYLLTNKVYETLVPEQGIKKTIDSRISTVLSYIQQNIAENISAAELAKRIHLSEDRFLHLFKEQMGAPLRQYILWQRMANAFKIFIEGKSLKEAAYEAGFSDPAHFTRTFVQLNGITPSAYAAMKDQVNFTIFLQ